MMNKPADGVLAEINAHPRDVRIRFVDEGHVYFVDGISDGWISATTFIHTLFPTFNSDQVIQKMMRGRNWATSKYHGMTPEQIKDSWEVNRDQAATAGTAMHADIERCVCSACVCSACVCAVRVCSACVQCVCAVRVCVC